MSILDLLRRPESKTLEFKRDLSSPTSVIRTITAFANTSGGTVVIGVEDGTRHVQGVEDPLALEERLVSMISDRIEPRLVPEIDVVPWRRTHVLVVQVHPSGIRPHHVRGDGVERGTYVRVGSSNRRADAALIAEMRRYVQAESFDEQPVPELSSEAIDFRVASELFEGVRHLTRRDLEILRLVTGLHGRPVPTVGGVLLFGHDRERLFPDAWLQVGRFDGTDKTRIIDHVELRGYPVPAIHEALEFIQRHLRRGADIEGARRRDVWELPLAAVREAVINAVVHADYAQRGAPIRIALFDDRLEVESPGILPFGLTVEDLLEGVSRLRNRVIGRVFHELGLIEQWGSGVQRMVSVCREAGLPAPDFHEIGLRFRVTLRKERGAPPTLDELDRKVLDLLADGVGRRTSDVAEHLGRTPRATRPRLAGLVERGLVVEIGTGPRDPGRLYYHANPAGGEGGLIGTAPTA